MESASGGGGTPSHGPYDPNYDDEMLAMIKAAMMEELGTGRKDTLPLADEGPRVNAATPRKKPVATDPNNPWQNVQFDDVDPADAELDSMYDGQLYRLRRGAAGRQNFSSRGAIDSGRGGHSPGRGRGSPSRGRRGGGHCRGGRGGGHMGHQNSPSQRQPLQEYVDNVRRARQKKVDSFIIKLRSLPTSEPSAPQQNHRPSQHNAQQTGNVASSSQQHAPAAASKYSLVSADVFAAQMGLGNPSVPKKDQPSYPVSEWSSPSVMSRESHEPPFAPPKVRLPQTPERESQRSILQNGEKGLAGSRWGAADQNNSLPTANIPAPPRLLPAAPSIPATVNSSSSSMSGHLLAAEGRLILRQEEVKATKGNSQETRGIARLVKNDAEVDQLFTIEYEVHGRKLLAQEVNIAQDTWKRSGSVITYKAKSGESTPTWTFKFQMPYAADSFFNLVLTNIPRIGCQQPKSEVDQSITPPIPTSNDPTTKVETVAAITSSLTTAEPNLNPEPVQKSAVSHTVEGTWSRKLGDLRPKSSNSQVIQTTEPVSKPTINYNAENEDWARKMGLLRSEPSTTFQSRKSVARAGPSLNGMKQCPALNTSAQDAQQTNSTTTSHSATTPVNLLETSPPRQHDTEVASSSPQRPSFELSFPRRNSDASDAGFLDHYHSGGSYRISSEVYSDMREVAGLEPLISFREEPPAYIRRLLDMDDTDSVQMTYEFLERHPSGSFLDQLSAIVSGSQAPASELTDAQILSSHHYQRAAMHLVREQVSASETFAKMPDEFQIHFITEKARKVLKMAVDLRQAETSDTLTNQQLTGSVLCSESEPSSIQNREPSLSGSKWAPATTNSDSGPAQPEAGITMSTAKSRSSRVTYSSDFMLSLRGHASRFKSELISGEVIDYVLPSQDRNVQPTRATPMNIIRILPNGRPIVAGRDEMPRSTRSSFGGSEFKPATSNAGWQQSGESATSASILSPPRKPISRGSRHVLTNSECDQQAKTFEGLHLSNQKKESPIPVEKPATLENTVQAQLLVEPNAPSNEPSIKLESPEPKPVMHAFNNPRFQLKDDNKEKFEEYVQNSSSNQGKKYVANNLAPPVKEEMTPVDTPARPSPCRESRAILESFVEKTAIKEEQPTAGNNTLPRRDSQVILQSLFGKGQSTKQDMTSTSGVAPPTSNAGLDSSSVKIEPVSSSADQPSLENHQPSAAGVETEVSIAPAMPPPARQTPTIAQNALAPKYNSGLSSSRWASEPAKREQFTRHAPIAHQPYAMNAPALAPTSTVHNPFQAGYTPQQAVANVLPTYPTMITHHPTLTTVMVQDPQNPSNMIYVTGPQVAQIPQPVIPTMIPTMHQENTPYGLHTPPAPTFPPRPDPARGPKRNDPFDTPTRGRGERVGTPQTRSALSPVRRGENVQAKLQSRLNESLASRSPEARR